MPAPHPAHVSALQGGPLQEPAATHSHCHAPHAGRTICCAAPWQHWDGAKCQVSRSSAGPWALSTAPGPVPAHTALCPHCSALQHRNAPRAPRSAVGAHRRSACRPHDLQRCPRLHPPDHKVSAVQNAEAPRATGGTKTTALLVFKHDIHGGFAVCMLQHALFLALCLLKLGPLFSTVYQDQYV